MFLVLFIAFLFGCNDSSKQQAEHTIVQSEDSQAFFPVTSYLKGQILDIKSLGVNPLKITTQAGKIDSSWVKMEALDSVVAIFLQPEIDSVNMAAYFKENKFHDKTLNSYTFTYEPKQVLPDTLTLRRWDVYVDPQSGKVRKIYLEKQLAGNRNVQLNWQADYGCKIVWFANNGKGEQSLEKEETIKWNFEEEQ